jgi:glyoxylase-like metal-dependent hydrolase (beta-lactamase superfamily II)
VRQIGPDLWAAESPLRMLGVQAGRRMAVVRLASGELLVHSPAPLDERLRAALERLGGVRFVVAASWLHGHLHMGDYARAELFAPPGLAARRPDLSFAGELGDRPDERWAADLDQALFRGQRVPPEVVFLHRPSRTLIVGDLVWNVTSRMPLSARVWAGRRPGVRPTPAFRLAVRDRAAARASLDRILAWDFDRILIGHGEVLESGGRAALERAYAWLR